MPYAPWSYYVLGFVVVVVAARALWLYFARQRGSGEKREPKAKAPARSAEEMVKQLSVSACKILQRLSVNSDKPKELQTLRGVLAGQQDEEQATQQALDLLVSTGCAMKVGTSQYKITPVGMKVLAFLHPKKTGAR